MKLPVVSSNKVIKALAKIGFEVDHQKGSHVVLRRVQPFARVVVPRRNTLPKGTLRAIIRETGLNRDKFIKLLM